MAQNLDSKNFYHDLQSFNNTSELIFADHYFPTPPDWWVVMTDVQGSTKAIENGKYKDVNTIGVGGIVSVQNALGGADFPFVFGGDGASLLIHESDLATALKALAHTRQIAKQQFGLTLRIAAIPIQDIHSKGREIRVAKMELSSQNYIALFQGGGLELAEKFMKAEQSKYLIKDDHPPWGEHTGLECRWNAVPSKKSQIVALIVQIRDPLNSSDQIYSKILNEIMMDVSDLRPITLENLPLSWPPQFLDSELRLRHPPGWRRWKARLSALAFTALAYVILKLKLKDASSEPGRYVRQLVQNTDYLKFDDCLRMIVDVDEAQLLRIQSVLKKFFDEKKIYYGLHLASHAIMTCYVQNPKRHIHFVDADQGGYTKAAAMLKSQRQERKSISAS